MFADPYKILGIDHRASKYDVEEAYREAARKCHPDLHPDDPDAGKRFQAVQEAYEYVKAGGKPRKKGAFHTDLSMFLTVYSRYPSRRYRGGGFSVPGSRLATLITILWIAALSVSCCIIAPSSRGDLSSNSGNLDGALGMLSFSALIIGYVLLMQVITQRRD